jgi:hypothetical protein
VIAAAWAGEAGDISSVSFSPSAPVTGDHLRAVAAGGLSPDDRARLLYRWSVNGQVVQDGRADALSVAVRRGDFVEVEASLGDPSHMRSNSVFIGNAPPTLHLSAQNVDANGLYTARIETSDPESDPVTLSLESGPPGMELSSPEGALRWQAGSDSQESYDVQVSAKDSLGAESMLTFQIKIRWESSAGDQNGESSPVSRKQ